MGYSKYLAFVILSCQTGLGFTLNTDRASLEGWETSDLKVDYNYADCPASISHATLNSALDSALELWNSTPSSRIRIQRGSEVTTTAAAAVARTTAGNPVVVCDKSFATGSGQDANQVPGLTKQLLLESGSNRIIYGAVLLNAQSSASANIANVEATRLTIVLAHEIGHLLGLGHSEDPSALMYFNLTDKTKLSLARDDLDGMTFLYGRNEPFNAAPLGCGSVERGNISGKSGRDDTPADAYRKGVSPGPGLLLVAFAMLAGFLHLRRGDATLN